ncbi:DUF494 family protein [Candidatus Tachikawaea gelatinosa]|uniref:Protein Smg n=1 Tax=Candidatus Tachikawaea gelatinosa TaxID=1410383 RepID=A0A090AJA9_9ENTR|nr:DUF494 family protein [Candidatus Tachikawaea gelatinosa]BAP58528.1 Protein smg homolog [Candidatus Tachikawaea gelatinosa]
MLDVLLYLFETYIYNETNINYKKITNDLTEAGFSYKDILSALEWLEQLTIYQKNFLKKNFLKNTPKNPSIRIYTHKENQRLDVKCQEFLLFLERIKILNIETREMVIDSVMSLDILEFSVNYLQWIVLIVLFNVSGYNSSYKKMEELVFHQTLETVH